jgi:FAD synthase
LNHIKDQKKKKIEGHQYLQHQKVEQISKKISPFVIVKTNPPPQLIILPKSRPKELTPALHLCMVEKLVMIK